MLIFICWLILSILCGVYASSKGRSGIGFFFLAACLSPLVGFIAVIIAKTNVKVIEESKIASGENKKCPFCAELIKKEAIVCRFCGKELPKQDNVIIKQVVAESDEELMKKYNITFSSEKYHYETYNYDKLQDAVNYAKKQPK
jgi:hypothetical protein